MSRTKMKAVKRKAKEAREARKRMGEDNDTGNPPMKKPKEKKAKDGGIKKPMKKTKPEKKTKPASVTRPPQTDYDKTVGLKDPDLLADHFAQVRRQHHPETSTLELEDTLIPTKAFQDTTDFDKPRIATELSGFVKKYTPGGEDELSNCDGDGTPHTLVLACSGIRTADLVRELRVYSSDRNKIGKFFAKHMPLEKNVRWARGNKIGIAVATSTRMKELIDGDAMKLHALRRIVIDGSYWGTKKQSIFDLPEMFDPMLALLNDQKFKSRYGAEKNKIEILVF